MLKKRSKLRPPLSGPLRSLSVAHRFLLFVLTIPPAIALRVAAAVARRAAGSCSIEAHYQKVITIRSETRWMRLPAPQNAYVSRQTGPKAPRGWAGKDFLDRIKLPSKPLSTTTARKQNIKMRFPATQKVCVSRQKRQKSPWEDFRLVSSCQPLLPKEDKK